MSAAAAAWLAPWVLSGAAGGPAPHPPESLEAQLVRDLGSSALLVCDARGLVATSADGTRTRELVPVECRPYVFDRQLGLYWFVTGGTVEALDLRASRVEPTDVVAHIDGSDFGLALPDGTRYSNNHEAQYWSANLETGKIRGRKRPWTKTEVVADKAWIAALARREKVTQRGRTIEVWKRRPVGRTNVWMHVKDERLWFGSADGAPLPGFPDMERWRCMAVPLNAQGDLWLLGSQLCGAAGCHPIGLSEHGAATWLVAGDVMVQRDPTFCVGYEEDIKRPGDGGDPDAGRAR